jgi:hypothetical protein
VRLVNVVAVKKHVLRLLLLIFGLFGAISINAQLKYEPYTFTTFAGLPPGSVDGKGSAARFQYPQSIVADGAGNLYVTDTNDHTIRKVLTDGTVTTFAGLAGVQGYVDGPRSAARFNYPVGIARDNAENLLVTDAGNDAIPKDRSGRNGKHFRRWHGRAR